MLTKSALLALVLTGAVAAGCSGGSRGGDKAVGLREGPVVLRMASTPWNLSDVPSVADFARRVATLSGGEIQINVANNWADYAPDAEVEVVRAVASDRVDLGWAGSRVFDSMGLSSFRALVAPMLIDSYPLEKAVLESAIPGQMLAGLRLVDVTGLGVFADVLRMPIGVHRALLSRADWRGISFGTYRSEIQEQSIRALGASPVEAIGFFRSRALDTDAIQGFEFDIRRYVRQGLPAKAPYVTANLVLWPQVDVFFANPSRLASLTHQQRGWLKQAADEAASHSLGVASHETTYITQACAMGARFVKATPADLAALRKSLSVVYREMERDPKTKALIRQIQLLKRSTPSSPGLGVPPGCSR
jgi:TRAP-type C4-dicarboxylate transport system substrate-binding protein